MTLDPSVVNPLFASLVKKNGGTLNFSDQDYSDGLSVVNNVAVNKTANGYAASLQTTSGVTTKTQLMNIFSSIKGAHSLTGQHISSEYDVAEAVDDVITPLPETPAMIGYCPKIGVKDNQTRNIPMAQRMAQFAEQGCIPIIDIHPANPFKSNGTVISSQVNFDGTSQDAVKPDLSKLLLSAVSSTAKTTWWKEIDVLVQFLKQFTPDTAIIFRPFHEANGRHFWWGTYPNQPSSREQDLIKLTADVKQYLSNNGINNIIWLHSGASAAWYAPNQYGRPSWVDLVGSSVYSDNGSFQIHPEAYDEMVATGKPVLFAEIGPFQKLNSLDYKVNFLDPLKGKWSKVVGWVAWHDDYALHWNVNGDLMITDTWMLNASDV